MFSSHIQFMEWRTILKRKTGKVCVLKKKEGKCSWTAEITNFSSSGRKKMETYLDYHCLFNLFFHFILELPALTLFSPVKKQAGEVATKSMKKRGRKRTRGEMKEGSAVYFHIWYKISQEIFRKSFFSEKRENWNWKFCSYPYIDKMQQTGLWVCNVIRQS